jgi:hypothetical protein
MYKNDLAYTRSIRQTRQTRQIRVILAKLGFRESGESEQSRLANVDKCIESDQKRLANVGKCIESGQNRLANVGECIESSQFSKMTILASTRIRQKWRIVGEYSNSTNLPASGHCLRNIQKKKNILHVSLTFGKFFFKK